MSIEQPVPSFADLPVEGVPSQEALRHDAPIALEPPLVQAPPAPSAPAPIPSSLPASTPNVTDAPAPPFVTTIAPHAPARAPYGPPDAPQTTIPAVVPTPNIPSPPAPTNLDSPTRPLGVGDLPQAGASLGGEAPNGLPGEIDYSLIPRLLPGDLALIPPDHAGASSIGIPGGVAPAQSDQLYFLAESALATFVPSASAPPAPAAPFVDPHLRPPAARGASQPVLFASSPESVPLSAHSKAEPQRLSDTASFPLGYESGDGLGAVGPVANDALYFVSHAGGHEGATLGAPPVEAKSPPQGYAPQLLPDAGSAAKPAGLPRQRRDDAKSAGRHGPGDAFLRK
jgi:cysteine desulfurase/selenocysteine lyase